MKKIILGLVFLCSSIFAGQVNIAVAANVSYAINELIAEFNKTNPDTKIQVTLGSSGKLTAQIKNGAPFNIFMAANMKFPESLYEDKIAITKPVVYAQGALAMLSSKELDYSKGINLIKEDSISKIAIANPKTAPYGTAAVEAIKNANLEEATKDKFVYAESISQTVTYATTAADIGFIAKSSLYDEKLSKYKENVNWASVDPTLYTPIKQGIVIINNAVDNAEVKAFYDFILGEKAKKIFVDYGYIVK
ncbi:MAG: molybdate ABC transporter substrate-binding protein [Arcobacter sp.]|jgi:molybdate transport system substrate-binding protein|uniref:Molybdenum ABC transporter ModABC, periplasmic molybdate-binding protein n=1 Tax=Arcobacter defluvii TaxID=873191 RepID=A0AAE7BCR2_9BACT|nr:MULTISPECIES: molybdate ABC transporter substrate-binding protein [Arcobacter]QKF76113.1 molybdenum ABC transporter ModABC, periplasmic molybdate-binding protein [Arcobacter defluvii]RXI32269.1 molybdate ABC transporter substrate-binding protein [Arcobacter defluvii]BAK71904.1 molybdenum ABC transporter substrate binding component [Arcobacter sp. L]